MILYQIMEDKVDFSFLFLHSVGVWFKPSQVDGGFSKNKAHIIRLSEEGDSVALATF